MEFLQTIGLALGTAWTSGINLYATVAVLGVFQKLNLAKLPGGLEVLDNWYVIGVAVFLYAIEFFADKIPYVDSTWDVIHTFIRVPAGAIMAYAAVAEFDPAVKAIALMIGGGVALTSHGTKTATRAVANLSPEPVSNWSLSIVEDILAFVGAILAIFAPIFVAVCVMIFIFFFIWAAPKLYARFKGVVRGVKRYINGENFAPQVSKI